MNKKKYVFCGVGGSGMSAIASYAVSQGHDVIGTDRSYDRGETPEKFKKLWDLGIVLKPQDGMAITDDVDELIVSSAVEDRIPDVKKAKEASVVIIKRPEFLARIFNAGHGIGIAGTSGKTTVTAMTGFLLDQLGEAPTILNGGVMLNYTDDPSGFGNAVIGSGESVVAEMDESDGSIALFQPWVAVLNNIALDHKSFEELDQLFGDFLSKAKIGAVLNADHPKVMALRDKVKRQCISYSLNGIGDLNAENITPWQDGVTFDLYKNTKFISKIKLSVPGRHNVANAMAAISVCYLLNLNIQKASQDIEKFRGTRRRMEIISQKNDMTIIDDYGHNPDKIAASLSTLKEFDGRIIAIFQPHGFGPTKMMKDELIETFKTHLGSDDILIMPEIYYAGGTADQSISSKDIIAPLKQSGMNAHYFESRESIISFVKTIVQSGDRIIVMGARDDTLTEFAKKIS